jgi:hypothetical protein
MNLYILLIEREGIVEGQLIVSAKSITEAVNIGYAELGDSTIYENVHLYAYKILVNDSKIYPVTMAGLKTLSNRTEEEQVTNEYEIKIFKYNKNKTMKLVFKDIMLSDNVNLVLKEAKHRAISMIGSVFEQHETVNISVRNTKTNEDINGNYLIHKGDEE